MEKSKSCHKCFKAIDSCTFFEQLDQCEKLIENFYTQFEDRSTYDVLVGHLNNKRKELMEPELA